MQRQSIPAEIKRLLSADLSKFVKEEIQRIVPILTTDEELSKSAPHAQEYYQDTSSWNYVAVTAIRETFLTMKNRAGLRYHNNIEKSNKVMHRLCFLFRVLSFREVTWIRESRLFCFGNFHGKL